MIAYLEGTLKRKHDDYVVVDVSGVGYEVFLPEFVRRTFDNRPEGEQVTLEIYYYASERQVRPILFGFNLPHEKRFFEKIIQVEDIGPLKAARALVLSVSTIAKAIETDNDATLKKLPGVGDRTAKKMIATLRGKCAEEALLRDQGYDTMEPRRPAAPFDELKSDALEILLALGHRRNEAETKIDNVMSDHPEIRAPEDLIREVYRREAKI